MEGFSRVLTFRRFVTRVLNAVYGAGKNRGIKKPVSSIPSAGRLLTDCLCRGPVLRRREAYGGFYFSEEVKVDPALAEKVLTAEARERLVKLRAALAALPEFKAAALEQALKAVAEELGIKAGPLVHPTRLALTGREAGPSLYHLMEVLGRERVLRRLGG